MVRLFASFGLILGLLSVLPLATTLKRLKSFSKSGDKNPGLSCILFGSTACKLECSVTDQLYNDDSYGECDENNTCICTKYDNRPISLYTRWKKMFDAEYVYDEIMKNDQVAGEVENIMSDARSTAEQYKKVLRHLLSPYQFSQLKVIDRSLAAKFIQNGKVNEKSLREHIATALNSANGSELRADYLKKFRDAVENIGDEGTLYNFAYKVARLRNKALEEIFVKSSKDFEAQKPELRLDGNPPIVEEVIHYAIINAIIERSDQVRNVYLEIS